MMMRSLLTVMIPTIGRPTLDRAIRSVAKQALTCELMVQQDPERNGPGPTLNRMLPDVRTPWLHTLGDDDMLKPCFAPLVAGHQGDADMLIFQMQYADGSVLPTIMEPASLYGGSVGCSYAVRTEVARAVGGWNSEPYGGSAEDWDMISTVRDRGYRIKIVPQVVYLVRPEEDL